MLSRDEKVKRVIELYTQDKPLREIAKEVHMSFGPISRIIKKHMGEESYANEPKRKERREEKLVLSKTVQAFKLFEQGKKQVEVAIKLDLGAEELTKIHKGYCDLKGSDDLNQVHEELRGEIPSFVKFYYDTKKAGMGAQQVVRALRIAEQLPRIENQFNTRRNDVYTLEARNERVENISRDLNNQIAAAKETLDSFGKSINLKQEELANLNSNKEQLESLITRLKTNSQEYCRVVGLAREELYQIVSDKRVMLHAALLSVLEALKEDPEKQVLIHDSLDDPLYTSPSIPFGLDPQRYRQLSLAKDLEIAEQFFEKLINNCVNTAVTSASSPELRHQPDAHF